MNIPDPVSNTPPTPASAPSTPPPLLHPASRAPGIEPLHRLAESRSLFWQNVVREILLTFPLLASERPEVADGRIGILTHAGERIPLGAVEPMFPCSIASPHAMQLCMAVQATVFNVRTPTGEMFTIPLHEIRAIHSLTDELMKELEDEARRLNTDSEGAEPFGFAAYTSLARQQGGDTESASAPKGS